MHGPLPPSARSRRLRRRPALLRASLPPISDSSPVRDRFGSPTKQTRAAVYYNGHQLGVKQSSRRDCLGKANGATGSSPGRARLGMPPRESDETYVSRPPPLAGGASSSQSIRDTLWCGRSRPPQAPTPRPGAYPPSHTSSRVCPESNGVAQAVVTTTIEKTIGNSGENWPSCVTLWCGRPRAHVLPTGRAEA